MKKSRFTEEQIAFALKQAETGTPVAEVIRRMGISEQTFYRWTSPKTSQFWADCDSISRVRDGGGGCGVSQVFSMLRSA